MRGPRCTGEAGFTLIELLVAVAVFSLAVMALLNVAGENTRTASAVQARVMADIVAENEAVRTMIAPGPLASGESEGTEPQGGRMWRWSRKVSPTAEADMRRVDITVAPQDGRGAVSSLSLFRGVR
jgi:general secretion pathway protein I